MCPSMILLQPLLLGSAICTGACWSCVWRGLPLPSGDPVLSLEIMWSYPCGLVLPMLCLGSCPLLLQSSSPKLELLWNLDVPDTTSRDSEADSQMILQGCLGFGGTARFRTSLEDTLFHSCKVESSLSNWCPWWHCFRMSQVWGQEKLRVLARHLLADCLSSAIQRSCCSFVQHGHEDVGLLLSWILSCRFRVLMFG